MSFSFDFHDRNVLVFGGTSGINHPPKALSGL